MKPNTEVEIRKQTVTETPAVNAEALERAADGFDELLEKYNQARVLNGELLKALRHAASLSPSASAARFDRVLGQVRGAIALAEAADHG